MLNAIIALMLGILLGAVILLPLYVVVKLTMQLFDRRLIQADERPHFQPDDIAAAESAEIFAELADIDPSATIRPPDYPDCGRLNPTPKIAQLESASKADQ